MSTRKALLVYMAGDNSLDSQAVQDILEMEMVGSTETLEVLVQVDRNKHYSEDTQTWSGTRRYQIVKSHQNATIESKVIEELGETNCGDPQTLIDFVKWATSFAKVNNVSLIIWSHGSGWKEPADFRASSNFTSSLFRHSQLQDMERLRDIAPDDSAGDILDTQELRKALNSIKVETGCEVDFLGYDACLMGNLEFLYETAFFSPLQICSPETEPGRGWNYDVVLSTLNDENVEMPKKTTKIIDAYIETIENNSESGSCLSAINSLNLDELAKYLGELGDELAQNIDLFQGILKHLQTNPSIRYKGERGVYADIRAFCKGLLKAPEITDRCRSKISQVESALSRVIVYFNGVGDEFIEFGGLSIYFPSMRPRFAIRSLYKKLSVTQKHPGWFTFIEKLYSYNPYA